MRKLTIVIVSYNVRHYLEQCIESVLRAATGIDHEIYVVDNASHDDTIACIRQRFGQQVTLIESQQNLGFARANNQAIRRTASQYVLLLNPDTIVTEDALQQVIRFMDAHPQAGGAGVMMIGADGNKAKESRRGLPTPWVALLKMLGCSKRYYMSHLPWDQPGQIDVMSGAFCMLRREALDSVGLLDEDFFMYGEDIDLSYRIKKGGYENWYVPAVILHYKGESTQKSSYRYVHIFYQAMLIFFRKHYAHLSFFVTAPIKAAIYFRALVALVQMQYWRVRLSLGFDGQKQSDTHYFFLGSDAMQAECGQLAMRKGLSAHQGPLPGVLPVPSCLVYDAGCFSYHDIITDLMRHAAQKPMLGIYHQSTKTLITPHDIFK